MASDLHNQNLGLRMMLTFLMTASTTFPPLSAAHQWPHILLPCRNRATPTAHGQGIRHVPLHRCALAAPIAADAVLSRVLGRWWWGTMRRARRWRKTNDADYPSLLVSSVVVSHHICKRLFIQPQGVGIILCSYVFIHWWIGGGGGDKRGTCPPGKYVMMLYICFCNTSYVLVRVWAPLPPPPPGKKWWFHFAPDPAGSDEELLFYLSAQNAPPPPPR